MTTESHALRAILLHLGARPGVLAVRTAAAACYLPDGRGGYRLHQPLPEGWPDVTCVIAGRAVAIEVKAPRLRRRDGTAPLRPSQERMRACWVEAGGVWITATCVADVDGGLQEVGL